MKQINVSRDLIWKGVALALILLPRVLPKATFDAKVLLTNEASKKLFERAGYIYVGNELYRSVPS